VLLPQLQPGSYRLQLSAYRPFADGLAPALLDAVWMDVQVREAPG
jgi:hypothetical protein